MENIYQIIQSYFNFRAAVLRSKPFEGMSKAEFNRLTGLCGDAKYRRTVRPDLWSPVEIYAFAQQIGFWDGGPRKIDLIADLIAHLPASEQTLILKASQLTFDKLQLRRLDAASWQAAELAKLQVWFDKRRADRGMLN